MTITPLTIVIAILALALNFIVSTNVAEWFVWGLFAVISLYFFIRSENEKKAFKEGTSKSGGEIVVITSMPYTTSIMGVVLVVLLFIDLSKLHLLWMYPIVALIFEFRIGKRAIKTLDKAKEHNNENQ